MFLKQEKQNLSKEETKGKVTENISIKTHWNKYYKYVYPIIYTINKTKKLLIALAS